MRDEPFFIFGMPRSRTAWLANLFCTDSVHCFHEISKAPPWDIRKTLESSAKDFVGLSEPNMLLFAEAMELYPGSRVVVIERAFHDVTNSLLLRAHAEIVAEVMRQQIEAIGKICLERHQYYGFNELDDIDRVLSLWNYLVPRVVPDVERIKQLMQFNVQVNYGMAT
jgi:hypothetical protein